MSTATPTFNKWLPVPLTQQEKIDRGKALAGQLIERNSVETEFTSVKSTFKGKLETIETEIARLRNIVNDGREFRDVECVVHEDWAEQRIAIVRTDTGEEVEARPMSLEERQRLPFNREA